MPETQTEQRAPLLSVDHLSKAFPIKQTLFEVAQRKPKKYVRAVDDVSFEVYEGETLGLVGESGCGKSSLSKTLARLYAPDKGDILFGGTNFSGLKGRSLRRARLQMQMVFQDPYSSLNPRMTARQMLYEILTVHRLCKRSEREAESIRFLEMVGLPKDALDRYPGQFSGGQRQRISIARALAMHPRLLIADEPVSALDVSIQAQVINLLIDLRSELNLTMLFISHDLRVVRYITDRVIVMYLGRIVESAPTEELYNAPAHPYTDILMKAAPVVNPDRKTREYAIEGEPPSPIDLPAGCRFSPRCPYATDRCRSEEPALCEIAPGRCVACHFPLNLGKME